MDVITLTGTWMQGAKDDLEGELYLTVVDGIVREVTDCNELMEDVALTFSDNLVRGWPEGMIFKPLPADRAKFPIVGRRMTSGGLPRIDKLPRF